MNTPAVRLIVDGDIFQPESGVLSIVGHGVNLRGVMGGFAGLVSSKFPEAAEPYRTSCEFNRMELGTTLIAETHDLDLMIAHIASQVEPGADARYLALEDGLRALYRQVLTAAEQHPSQKIQVRLPMIGAGIGGLDPIEVADIIFRNATAGGSLSPGGHVIVPTTLYLLSSDSFTEDVRALHQSLYGAEKS